VAETKEVNIKLLGCVDHDDVEQICVDADIDIYIEHDGVSSVVTECSDERFLLGVIAALMHDPC